MTTITWSDLEGASSMKNTGEQYTIVQETASTLITLSDDGQWLPQSPTHIISLRRRKRLPTWDAPTSTGASWKKIVKLQYKRLRLHTGKLIPLTRAYDQKLDERGKGCSACSLFFPSLFGAVWCRAQLPAQLEPAAKTVLRGWDREKLGVRRKLAHSSSPELAITRL